MPKYKNTPLPLTDREKFMIGNLEAKSSIKNVKLAMKTLDITFFEIFVYKFVIACNNVPLPK